MNAMPTSIVQNMARAQGINTNVAKVLALALSNALVGLSGALIAQYQGSADVNMGRGAIVIGLVRSSTRVASSLYAIIYRQNVKKEL